MARSANQITTERSPVLLCVGDSLVEDLPLHTVAGFNIVNAGISGAGVLTLLHCAPDLLSQARGATVLLAIGVNDANRGHAFSAGDWEAWYRELCVQLAAGAANFIVQTVLPVEKRLPWGEQLFSSSRIATINERIRNLAGERGYALIDMHARFAAADGFMPAGFTVDGVHLTGASYAMWHACWEEQLPRFRKGRPPHDTTNENALQKLA